MGGGSKKQTVGYKYSLGMHFILCAGPVDKVSKLYVDGREAWSGDSSVTPTASINQPNLFGGESREGGVVGSVDIMHGTTTQPVNDYLQSRLPNQPAGGIPAFRGVVSLVLRKVYVGMNPYLKPWSAIVSRIFTTVNGGPQWYPEKAAIGEDMNPIHIVRELLTASNSDWGGGIDATDIDDLNFRAAADQLYSEDFGLSFLWRQDSTIFDFIQEIMRHIDGVLTRDRLSGKFVIKLIRDDYDFNLLPVVDTTIFQKIVKQKTSDVGQLPNQVVVKYWDRAILETRTVTIQNLALVDTVGYVNSTTINYPGVCTESMASRLASRDVRSVSTPLTTLTIQCNKLAGKYMSGDVIRLDIPHEVGIPDSAWRVVTVSFDQGSDNVQLELIEDLFATTNALSVIDEVPLWVNPVSTPVPAVIEYAYESTFYDLVKLLGQTDAELYSVDSSTFGCAGVASSGDTFSMSVYDADNLENVGSTDSSPGFVLSGGVDRVATSFPLAASYSPEDVALGSLAIIGEERVRVVGVSVGILTVERGVEDTIPQVHATGSKLVVIEETWYTEDTEYLAGQSVNVKLLPSTGVGALDPSLAVSLPVNLVGRHYLPYPPAAVRFIHPGGIVGYWSTLYEADPNNLLQYALSQRNRLQQTAGYLSWYDTGDVLFEPNTTIVHNLTNLDTSTLLVNAEFSLAGTISIDVSTFASGNYRLEVWTKRDGELCYQPFSHDFYLDVYVLILSPTGLAAGYRDATAPQELTGA